MNRKKLKTKLQKWIKSLSNILYIKKSILHKIGYSVFSFFFFSLSNAIIIIILFVVDFASFKLHHRSANKSCTQTMHAQCSISKQEPSIQHNKFLVLAPWKFCLQFITSIYNEFYSFYWFIPISLFFSLLYVSCFEILFPIKWMP